jgi:hypothetical protein
VNAEKNCFTGILRINLGIFLIFFGTYIVALKDYSLQSNVLQYALGIIAGMGIAVFTIYQGVRKIALCKNNLTVDQKKKIKMALLLNLLGFIVLGSGAYYLSIVETGSFVTPTGENALFYYHPYSTLAFTLFLFGSGIEILILSLYHHLIKF